MERLNDEKKQGAVKVFLEALRTSMGERSRATSYYVRMR